MLDDLNRETAFAPPLDCPLDSAITALGGKWKLAVLRALFVGGAQRYNQLSRAVPGINPKELTRNLRELENGGLVLRATSDGAAIYKLTELGLGLRPTFQALGEFGSRYRQSRRSPVRAG